MYLSLLYSKILGKSSSIPVAAGSMHNNNVCESFFFNAFIIEMIINVKLAVNSGRYMASPQEILEMICQGLPAVMF